METLSQSKIKQIRNLHQKKIRDEQGVFIVEGEKMVMEVLNTMPDQIVYIVATDNFTIPDTFNVDWYYCTQDTLKKCSSLKSPNKAIALVKKLIFPEQEHSFIIALDAVQDPGNMGTIIRLADWFGVHKIICSQTTVDCYNPKVIQASMGSFLRVQIEYTDLKQYFKSSLLPVFGALLDGSSVYQQKLTPKGILLMGNEGNGISEEIKPFINHPISIPSRGNAESLNVSIATGILLSEFFRG